MGDLLKFYLYGINEGLLAHGFHDSRSSKDRYASLDSKLRIECLRRGFLSFRNGDYNFHSAGVVHLIADRFHSCADLYPRTGIDGRVADRLVEARFGHSAHALAAVYDYPLTVRRACACLRVCKGNMSSYLHAVCDIRVVARVLEYRGPRPCFIRAPDFYRNTDRNPLGRHEGLFNRLLLLSGVFSCAKKQKPCSRGRRQRRAGSCRVSVSEHFCSVAMIILKRHFALLLTSPICPFFPRINLP